MSMSNQSDPSVGDVLLRQILPLRHVVERGHNQARKVQCTNTRGTKNPCKNRGLIFAYGGPDGFRTQCLVLSDFLLITYV